MATAETSLGQLASFGNSVATRVRRFSSLVYALDHVAGSDASTMGFSEGEHRQDFRHTGGPYRSALMAPAV